MAARTGKSMTLNRRHITLTIWGGVVGRELAYLCRGHHLLKMALFQVTVSFGCDWVQPDYRVRILITLSQSWWYRSHQDVALGMEMRQQL